MKLNRKVLNEIVLSVKNPDFQGEVRHAMSIDREYDYDEIFAALDIQELAEGWIRDNPKDKWPRKVLAGAREALIAIGFYRVMSQEEIENTWSSSGTVWIFKKDGKAYTSDYSASEWEPEIHHSSGET